MPDIWMDVDTALGEVPVNIFPLTDDTDFKSIEGAVAYNAAGMTLRWHFVTCAGAYTVTSVTPTTGGNYDWTDQGDSGIYTIEIPASGGASINNDTEGFGWFTGSATGVLPWRGPVIGFRRAALNDLLIEGSTASTNLEDFFDGTGYAGGTAKLDCNLVNIAGSAVSTSTAQLGVNAVQAGGTAWGSAAITAASIATGAITNAKFAAGAIDAAAIAANAIDADSLAADAGTEIGTAVWATETRTLTAPTNITSTDGEITLDGSGYVTYANAAPPSAATIADAVWDEASTGHTDAGKAGAQMWTDIDAILADTGTDGVIVASIANNAITAAAIATGAIDADAIADNAIDAGALAADCITSAKIADNAIAAEHIAAGAIDNATFAADVGSTAYATNIIALAADKAIVNTLGAAGANLTAVQLAAAGIDAIFDRNSSLSISFENLINRIYQMISNKMTVNETTGAVALRNIGDSGDIATGNVASSSGTTTRAELTWS